jgi:hypothetical protein
MFNERNNVRYLSRGKARLEGIEGEALLNDLSNNGCCVEFVAAIAIHETAAYKIEITPEPESGIPAFTVSAEPRWTRPAPYSCSVGFQFFAMPKEKQVQKYMDFLASAIEAS